jgi:hypothetical protein
MFAPYIRNPLVYKCPADLSQVHGAPRTRTYSANAAVGTLWTFIPGCNSYPDGPVTGNWLAGSDTDSQTYGRVYQKTSQMNRPNPGHLFIFVEEHPDSINDSTLFVQIDDTSIGGSYIDIPSNLHDGAAPFSCADGHAEIRKWQGPHLRKTPFVQGGPLQGGPFSANRPTDLLDLNWLQSRTSSPVNPNTPYLTPQN